MLKHSSTQSLFTDLKPGSGWYGTTAYVLVAEPILARDTYERWVTADSAYYSHSGCLSRLTHPTVVTHLKWWVTADN